MEDIRLYLWASSRFIPSGTIDSLAVAMGADRKQDREDIHLILRADESGHALAGYLLVRGVPNVQVTLVEPGGEGILLSKESLRARYVYTPTPHLALITQNPDQWALRVQFR